MIHYGCSGISRETNLLTEEIDHYSNEDDSKNICNDSYQKLPEIGVVFILQFSAQNNQGENTTDDTEHSHKECINNQKHKSFSIFETDAVAQPWTMMIHHQDTSLASTTVMGSFGFEDLTNQAVSLINIRSYCYGKQE